MAIFNGSPMPDLVWEGVWGFCSILRKNSAVDCCQLCLSWSAARARAPTYLTLPALSAL